MTNILRVTDGATSVNFYGSTLGVVGWVPGSAGDKDTATERTTFWLKGTSHDDIASQVVTLNKLLRLANEYTQENWQELPVYLIAKADNETSNRYALIHSARIIPSRSTSDYMFASNNYWVGLEIRIERDRLWRSEIPETAATAINLLTKSDTDADTEHAVGNVETTAALTHIYSYDASAVAFSANLVAAVSWPYFEVSGSSPGVSDIIYFGSDVPFFNVVMDFGTAGVHDVTLAYEYWDGAAWAAIAPLDAHADIFQNTGKGVLGFSNIDADWATTAINGATRYWVRIRITAGVSWTTSPVQSGDHSAYTQTSNYVEIANTVIGGDANPLVQIRWLQYANQQIDAGYGMSWLAMGMKTRGLTNFVSMLNAGDDNVPCANTYKLDTTKTAAAGWPAAFLALCDFATLPATNASRISWDFTTAAVISDYQGVYRLFLRCRQINGVAGDVAVNFFVTYGTISVFSDGDASYRGDAKTLQTADSSIEFVDLGRVELVRPGIRVGEDQIAQEIKIHIEAESSNDAVPDLEIYDIILIPVDEWSMTAESDFTLKTGGQGVEIDNGVFRQGSTIGQWDPSDADYSPTDFWVTAGELPKLLPKRKSRIYFLSAVTAPSSGLLSGAFGTSGVVEVRTVNRWNLLRGAG